ncbi:MAG: hypothetical protein CSA35_00925 [Dethiosulfovibrio peptidovorans]|nr:MAG: hypothetical protein CSA35_00925 [Dethiosulfovibrio peptidovorans]
MDWRSVIPQGLRDTETELYVNAEESRPWIVDCALGSSPVGPPPIVQDRFGPFFGDDLWRYTAPADRLSEPFCQYWGNLVHPHELAFANGTDTILVILAKALGAPGGLVLGLAPQFTDAPVHFQLSGCEFRPIFLHAPSYAIEIKDILAGLDRDVSLVYLDRPHNPTGQLMPLNELDQVIQAAEEMGALVIVDEAYGDFVPEDQSCLHLNRSNLVCLRTFSKGWGMAGIRGGYAVFRSPLARELYLRVSPPFTVDALAFAAIPMALKDAPRFLPPMRREVASIKSRVSRIIAETSGYSIAHTHPSVAIMMVTALDKTVNLYDRLMDHGIKTAPGSGFLGIGDNSVRLRIPPESDLDDFTRCWTSMVKS